MYTRYFERKNAIVKWFIVLPLAVCIFLGSGTNTALAQPYRIPLNWDIEVGVVGNLTTPTNWTLYDDGTAGAANNYGRRRNAGGVGVPLCTLAVNTGNYCLELAATGAAGVGNTDWSGGFQDLYGVYHGDTVVFSAWGQTLTVGAGTCQMRLEFYDMGGNRIRQLQTGVASVGAYANFTVTETAPTGCNRVRFVLEATANVAAAGNTALGDFDTLSAGVVNGGIAPNPDDYPIGITFTSNKSQASVGDILTFTANVTNRMNAAVNDIEAVLTVPAGFDLIEESVRVGGTNVAIKEGSVVIPIGTLTAGETRQLVFQLLITGGVEMDHNYAVMIYARNWNTLQDLSDEFHIPILIIPDPLFDLGTIIGKVFHDANENGVQDEGEPGVPGVRIATEEGVVVRCDEDGKYHIPAVRPGRHLVKIDGHTLPRGTKFVTEEAYITKVTNGLLCKVNFAVVLPETKVPEEYRKDLVVQVMDEVDSVEPEISLSMTPIMLKMGHGVLEEIPTFSLQTNYGNLIREWRIEIRDVVGRIVWSGYGTGTPPSSVRWNGKDEFGEPVAPGDYAARFIVMDRATREDWSPLVLFRVLDKKDPGYESLEDLDEEPFPAIGYFNIAKDGKRSIPVITRGTIRVRGRAPNANQVQINDRNVNIGEDGRFDECIFMPHGEEHVRVDAIGEEGEIVSYQEPVKVSDSYFFMVALGEMELGENIIGGGGNLETVGRDDDFKNAFYHDGRFAYYLKAKVKGRFLVTSTYDTKWKNSKLFTNLDPDQYYPVYGDASTIDYEASDTQERLYVLVEADKSFFKVGSFNTDFTETELATHNRTMSGVKGHFETLTTTKYGDSKAAVTFFEAQERQCPAHDEMVGTGGSLYYLAHRNVIEGSEKVYVELRDKYTQMVLSRDQLMNGEDYEIDYQEGRLILNYPLQSVSSSSTIVSADILNGNNNFLIVDYEFNEINLREETARALRAYYNYGNWFRLGGSYIQDKRPHDGEDYQLAGVDCLFRFGENTRLYAEYAESINTQLDNSYSTDGGLTYTVLDPLNNNSTDEGNLRKLAYLVKGETRLGPKTEISGYFQEIQPGFSNADSVAQEGYKKWGFYAKYKFNPYLSFTFRHDRRESTDWGNANSLALADVGEVDYTTIQGAFKYHPLAVDVEYCHQKVDRFRTGTGEDFRARARGRLIDLNAFENAIAGRISYQLTDEIRPYIRGQVTTGGQTNNQLTAGVEARLDDKSTLTFEEVVGSIGNATLMRFETQVSETNTTYADYALTDDILLGRGSEITIGSSTRLDDRSRLISERRYSSYQGKSVATTLYGYNTTLLDGRLGINTTFERSQIQELVISDHRGAAYRNAGTIGVTYNEPDFLRADSKLELRWDEKSTDLRQWLTYNTVELKVTKDLTCGGRINYSNSRNLTDQDVTGRFLELNLGFAYRPVDYDRLNILGRYTHLVDISLDRQFVGIAADQKSHILSFEGVYDITSRLQLVEKIAYKWGIYSNEITGPFDVYSYLWINRFNYHVTRKWDVALEYRALFQQGAAQNLRHGVLVEIAREVFEYGRLGVGYNFTDFDDNLRSTNNYDRNGFYTRLTGKF